MDKVKKAFGSIIVGDWVVWLRDTEDSSRSVWDIGQVVRKEVRGESYTIDIKHPSIIRLNFEYYFSNGYLEIIESMKDFS